MEQEVRHGANTPFEKLPGTQITYPRLTAPAAPPVPHFPRLRALALFGRRPPQLVDSLVMPASENLHKKQKFTPNSPYGLLRAIRRRGRSRHLAVLAQPVQGLMLTEAAQFEMADFNDRCRNFGGKSTSHEQWPANILAEEFQPAEDVDVAPDGGEVEAIARANIAVFGITIVQSNIDGNMLLDLGRLSLERSQRCLRCSQGRLTGRRRIIAGDWKDRDDRITDILQDVTFAADDAGDDQIEEGI